MATLRSSEFISPDTTRLQGESTTMANAVLNLSELKGSKGFAINGIDADDRSGRSVSNAGDINGDGLDDLIIGAYRADSNGKLYAGSSYVVFGSNSRSGA
ncbi:MAG: integrin alpha, partial [Nostoc sp.]|uniref:integrin alpha n=1 Tax=Nostoc sp. TaxID=1180 RepID=UPI002FFBB6FD